jgi:hypothetical protein
VKISRELFSAKTSPILAVIQIARSWLLKFYRYMLHSRLEVVGKLIGIQECSFFMQWRDSVNKVSSNLLSAEVALSQPGYGCGVWTPC